MSHKHYATVFLTVLLATLFFIGVGIAGAASLSKPYGKVPQSLQTIESKAEDVIDLAGAGHWPQVSRDVAAITHSWSTYQRRATYDGVTQAMQEDFSSVLSKLQRASADGNAQQTMQAANDLSAIVADMSDYYHPVFPSDIARLDVLQRQVILDTTAGHMGAAARTLYEVSSVLYRLRPSIEVHDGTALAQRFEKNLAEQSKALQAGNKAALIAHARHGLELVDRLEKLYS